MTGTEFKLLDILAKHGPWAVFATVATVGVYMFALEPMAKERVVLIEMLRSSNQQNQVAVEKMVENTRAIAAAASRQGKSLNNLDETLVEANEIMRGFADEMRETHPRMHEKLDRLEGILSNQHFDNEVMK